MKTTENTAIEEPSLQLDVGFSKNHQIGHATMWDFSYSLCGEKRVMLALGVKHMLLALRMRYIL